MTFSKSDLSSIQHLAKAYYGIEASVKALPGELDLNYFLKDKEGNCYTLKIAHFGETIGAMDMQNQVMLHLAQQNLPLDLPTVLPNNKLAINFDSKR